MNFRNLIGLFALLFVAYSCANITQLTGGEKDTTPAKVVAEKSSPDRQTNSRPKKISLTFDEYVQLKNESTQIVVSPPLNHPLKTQLNGKKLTVSFSEKDTLRENTTYVVNFGSAVRDFTEETNIVPNLRFVFSTGDIIDSLSLRTFVTDATTGKAADSVLVMLYDNLADTVLTTQKPFYFTKTNSTGYATLENLRAGKFQLFALYDADLNFIYNQDNEKIGFPTDNFITLPLDSTQKTAINLRVFSPTPQLRLLETKTEDYGFLQFIFNQNITDSKNIQFEKPLPNAIQHINGDTLMVWYNTENDSLFQNKAFIQLDSKRSDTLSIKSKERKSVFLKDNQLRLYSPTAVGKPKKDLRRDETAPQDTTSKGKNIRYQHFQKPFFLRFGNPLKNIDKAKIQLLDSVQKSVDFEAKVDEKDPRTLVLSSKWQEKMPYQITILPNTLTDIYGLQNTDTLAYMLQVAERKTYGDINLSLEDLNVGKNYIVQLLSSTGAIEASYYVAKKTTFQQRIEVLPAGEYSIKVIQDDNENRQWDTGNLAKRQQAEKIFTKTLERLRPNWELEATLNFK